MNLEEMTKPQLAARYNELASKLGKPTTKRMESREAGIRRVRELMALLPQSGERKPKPKRPATPRAIKAALAAQAFKPKPYVKGERTHAKCAAETWQNPKVAEARAKRYAVQVAGVQYRSVNAAFKALQLPRSKVCTFRPQLIKDRVRTFEGHTFELLGQGE